MKRREWMKEGLKRCYMKENDIIGFCESCGKPLKHDDDYVYDESGCYICRECYDKLVAEEGGEA